MELTLIGLNDADTNKVIILNIIFCFSLMFYLIPLLIADARNLSNFKSIAMINILLGWTFLGWLICFFWSLYTKDMQE